MKLSSHEEYGLRCLLHLARHPGEQGPTIPEISQGEGISTHYVAKLMRMLRRGGMVKSTRGRVGGYVLARPADQIPITEVLSVLGGRLYDRSFCEQHSGNSQACAHSVDCAMRALWRTVQESVDRVLAHVTLQDLRRGEEEMVSWVTIAPPSQPAGSGLTWATGAD